MVYNPVLNRWRFLPFSEGYQSAMGAVPEKLDKPAIVFVMKASQIRPWRMEPGDEYPGQHYDQFMHAAWRNLQAWRRAVDQVQVDQDDDQDDQPPRNESAKKLVRGLIGE
jgi:hypothetical protein